MGDTFLIVPYSEIRDESMRGSQASRTHNEAMFKPMAFHTLTVTDSPHFMASLFTPVVTATRAMDGQNGRSVRIKGSGPPPVCKGEWPVQGPFSTFMIGERVQTLASWLTWLWQHLAVQPSSCLRSCTSSHRKACNHGLVPLPEHGGQMRKTLSLG